MLLSSEKLLVNFFKSSKVNILGPLNCGGMLLLLLLRSQDPEQHDCPNLLYTVSTTIKGIVNGGNNSSTYYRKAGLVLWPSWPPFSVESRK